MIGIPIGLLYANAGEWLVHKYILHGLGKRKRSYWSFHWHEHHKTVRQEAMRDSNYEASVLRWNGQGKEALGLIAAGLVHLPLFPIAPFFTGAYLYSLYNYYRVHKRAHLDPEWARQNVPWHYDHHMGPDQNANWCVTRPWTDVLVGTRKPYVGTPLEAERTRRERAVA